MTDKLHSATITVEQNDAQADYEGFDEFNVGIRNPIGETPDNFYERVDEYVRENATFEHLVDGLTKDYGTVEYGDDEIHDISLFDWARS